MAHDTRRPDRVAAAIREEVAKFLAEGVKDPRVVGLVTVTGVDVTRDLRHAKVYVSILGSDAERAATLDGLASAASHFVRALDARSGFASRPRSSSSWIRAWRTPRASKHCSPRSTTRVPPTMRTPADGTRLQGGGSTD